MYIKLFNNDNKSKKKITSTQTNSVCWVQVQDRDHQKKPLN